MNAPITFSMQEYTNHFNLQPSVVKSRSTDLETHKRYLYTKLYSVYKFTLPDSWALNWFRYWLFRFGSIAVLYTKEFGWVAMPYGITGLDLYYQPSTIIVSNHLFKEEKAGKIGVNAEIIHLMDDYWSLDDLVTKYASMLAQIDKDFNVNLMNANVSMMAEVKSKKQGDDITTAYGMATEGKPLVVINEKILDGKQLTTLMPNVKQNYIGQELLMARRNVVNQFLTDIGIPNFNQDKKAQQNQKEISENDDETKAVAVVILENLQKCFEKANRISGLGLSVELRPSYLRGGDEYGESDAMGDVPV